MANSPLEFCAEAEEIGSEGLRKQVVQQGSSWKSPSFGDEVEVNYSGFVLGGSTLDSSWERGVPFRFKLGQCEVIKGWDDGIATMKKGERAVFTIPPKLAYGEAGTPPSIPPNSTLVFDIELLSWSTIRDLSSDGGILKKIVSEGEGWAVPRDHDEVLVKYKARLKDGTIVSKSDTGVEFYVNDGYLCAAVGKAVKTMRKGEKAELSVKFPYGIPLNGFDGNSSFCGIPSNASLTIDLELVSWKNVIDITENRRVRKKIVREGEWFDRPNEGSLVKVKYIRRAEDGTICESKGSEIEPFEYLCFQDQILEDLDRAIATMRKGEKALVTIYSDDSTNSDVSRTAPAVITALYDVELISFTKAAKCVELDHSFTDEEKALANALRISCNSNNAACKIKLGDYVEAVKLCSKVLELDPLNVKALYRRSQSYLRISELEKAEIDIKKALAIDPNNREVKLEYAKLKGVKKEYAKYEAEIFGSMLSKMSLLQK
ncbi:hypothetical protein Sjap_002055 [Stephania japonica]|uniref:peptidylprolyl isomerase n=1 Tax=Stephania japonica TaxID=461633 RepID=A0AAP0KNQ6_9MAGN